MSLWLNSIGKVLRCVAVLLAAAMPSVAAHGQQECCMENGETLHVYMCGNDVTVYDNGGAGGNYDNDFNGYVVLHTTAGTSITLTGTYNTESCCDKITVTNGSTTLVGPVGGNSSLQAVSYTGEMWIHFYSDGSITKSGFALTASSSVTADCGGDVGTVTIVHVDTTSAELSWSGSSQTVVVSVNGITQTFSGGTAQLTGLTPATSYSVSVYAPVDVGLSCCTRSFTLTTNRHGSHGCIDPADFDSPYVTAYYGNTGNPYESEGVINYGSYNSLSRHTIHTSVTEIDTRTGYNGLHTVPPGSTSSVRLGNWQTNSEAEALLYVLEVDTLVSDLLILKYAAVLQDPNHSSEEQPRFRLELLNSNMEVIDPTCGVADFIANSSLGWNQLGNVLWKDWTNVGIDLAPYAGQTICIRLTTYDCSQGGHYGYAYFTLECSRKSIQSQNCGEVGANSFTVPSGFTYLWYTDTVTQSPISTAQTLYTTGNEGVEYFYCRLGFIDKAECHFNMSAYAGARYPLASFDDEMRKQGCNYDVTFTNRSTVSADGINPIGSEGCETAQWFFGDGGTSTQYHATHTYTLPGDYEVTLVSGLASDACTDTARTIVHIPADSIATISGPGERCAGAPEDTLVLSGIIWSQWDSDTIAVAPSHTTTYNISVIDTAGCQLTLTHTLTVHPSYDDSVMATVCVNMQPYHFDTLDIDQTPGTVRYGLLYSTIDGCDSLVTLVLTVNDTSRGDTVATACDHFGWHGRWFDASTDSATIMGVNADGCDSTTVLHLTVLYSSTSTVHDTTVENSLPHNFNGILFGRDVADTVIHIANAVGCDSAISYSLTVHWNVTTWLDTTVCTTALPLVWGRLVFDSEGTQRDTLTDRFGADSVLVMTLHTAPTFDDTLQAVICDNGSYHFGNAFYSDDGVYTDSLLTGFGCDSLSTLVLGVLPVPTLSIAQDTLCSAEQYRLSVTASTAYTRWSSTPHDPMLDGHEHEATVLVSPLSTTVYTALADHYEQGLCPVTENITLAHLSAVHAGLKVIPERLRIDQRDFTAYDISHHAEYWRRWYIDGAPQVENGVSIARRIDNDADSVVVALEVGYGSCQDTAVKVLRVIEVAVFAPNVFTPDKEDNNRFVPVGLGLLEGRLYIYNRDGTLVFSTDDYTEGWDGRDRNGRLCEQGSYVWKMNYRAADLPESNRTEIGSVLLLR